MRNLSRAMEAARAVALASDGVGKRHSFRVGAVLCDSRGHIVRAKANSYRTHPVLARYSPFPHQHAETACILAHGMDNCCGCSLVVVRVLKNGDCALAKPCAVCHAMIQDASIANVWYSTDNGMEKLV